MIKKGLFFLQPFFILILQSYFVTVCMSSKEKQFKKASEEKAFDLNHRKKINFNISKYLESFEKGKSQYQNLDEVKLLASEIKKESLLNLDYFLQLFSDNFEKNGGKVYWAYDVEEANNYIKRILQQEKAKIIVKSKSITTEELKLNEFLEKRNYDVYETDLGEFIVQVAGEKPYHIVTPAMHKSKEDIALLFNEKFNTSKDATPQELTLFVRKLLREKFINADVGITGANFILPDIGGISITENEGNGLLTAAFPKVHIAIVGIEKVIPSVKYLSLFLPLLSTHGTGQYMSVYNTIYTSSGINDIDGPQKMYVILLDNGRSDLYAEEETNIALSCIRCGACLNVCPVYQNIGGYTYDVPYTGPIGSIISPYYEGIKEYKHLSFACTLCGKCTETCPVKIPLHELLLLNRKKFVEREGDSFLFEKGIKFYEYLMKDRKHLDIVNGNIKNFFVKTFAKNSLGDKKEPPTFAKHSFAKMFEKQKNKD